MLIKIGKIVYPGKSLGRCEDGLAAFTEGALPGETVELQVTKAKKSFREGFVTRIVEPSPLRISPRCPSFGKCGGCSFQHVEYRQQLELKQGYVQELLAPFGAPIAPVVESPEPWAYRNKMEFSFFDDGGRPDLGLHVKGAFNRYFPVPPCFIADADLVGVMEDVLAFARESGLGSYDKKLHAGFYRHLVLRKAKRTGQVLVNLVTNRADNVAEPFFAPLAARLGTKVASLFWTVNGSLSDAVVAEEVHLLAGQEQIEEQLCIKGRTFRFAISPFSFFQTNTLGTEKLYETVIDLFAGTGDDRLLDLYCGTGTIGIVLAPFVQRVLGVEQVPQAVENARVNGRLNGIGNITFAVGSVEKWIKTGETVDANALVIDPPRGGISGKVVQFILRTQPEKIIYVSCNPSTLARDLKEILAPGGYRLTQIAPVDMFPQTYHIETVAALRRVAGTAPA
jgi:23S rRNA (uracil1939-C5)-methyltransferase